MNKGTSWIEKFKGEESISQGQVDTELFWKYYDESSTIQVAGATDPGNPDDAVYNQERVYEALGQRRAKQIMVINDQPAGGQTLFVIVSHRDPNQFSPERPIYPQEFKVFWNVYELRLRSALQGHAYRTTEYYIRRL